MAEEAAGAGTGADENTAALAAEGAPEMGTAEDAAGGVHAAATDDIALATEATVTALAMGESVAVGQPPDHASGEGGG